MRRLTLRLFSIAGIPVHLHWTLPVMVVAMVVLTPGFNTMPVLQSLGIFFAAMFVSILAHELGHCVAARRCDGEAERITLWPLGGFAEVTYTDRHHHKLAVALSGVGVNLLLAAMAGGLYYALGRGNPGFPSLVPGPDFLKVLWGMNLALAVLNLLPGYPLDGGNALEALLRTRVGRAKAAQVALISGVVIGIGLTLYGVGTGQFLLTFVGLFSLSECGRRYQDLREHPQEDQSLFGGHDFSQGFTSLEESQPAPVKKVRVRRSRAEANANAVEEEPVEPPFERPVREVARERLDALLDRIAADGISSLSPEEREFLTSESERLRARKG